MHCLFQETEMDITAFSFKSIIFLCRLTTSNGIFEQKKYAGNQRGAKRGAEKETLKSADVAFRQSFLALVWCQWLVTVDSK